MAITKVGAMTDPPVAGDYTILQAKRDAYAKQIGNQGMILTEGTNTTNAPKIAMGSYITPGGTLFVVDTEDFAVPAPAGNGTYYLKVAASGATLALSWVASLTGYTWNAIYNGLYHSNESQILPYQLVKSGATLTKRKITNLMQGSGFVTVDWTGAVQSVYFDQGVKTTDSPTFASVDTGFGANEVFKVSRETIDFGVVNSDTNKYISSMVSGETRHVNITGYMSSSDGATRYARLYLPSGGTYDVLSNTNDNLNLVGSNSSARIANGLFSGGSLILEEKQSVSINNYLNSSFIIRKL